MLLNYHRFCSTKRDKYIIYKLTWRQQNYTIVAFVDDFTVDGRSEGAWKIENTAGRFSTSIPHHSFLRGQEMHGFIQEPSVSRQPVTGQQKLKCGILIMNVDGHYSKNWFCYSNIRLRCYQFTIYKNANSWHTVKYVVFTSSDHRRRNRGRFSFLVLVFFKV